MGYATREDEQAESEEDPQIGLKYQGVTHFAG
jgi:hypothetical protein